MTELKQGASPTQVQSANGLVASAKAHVREVQPDDVAGLLAQGAVLIDVRERVELEAEGIIPGAVHAPRGVLEWSVDPQSPTFIRALDPTKPVVLYCRSGNRSALAAQVMEKMGYGDVTSLQGGIVRWKTEGRPVAAPQHTL
ncbi:MAG TPA: rhodanese-like domain-containing protein [Gemmatimonadales bacterium]|nr:rhodanese-like domain-containing protein [Gemmatimonadales bacterium]